MRHLLLIIGVLALAGCGEKDFPETSSTKIQTTSESGADTESQVEIVPITAEEAADIIDNAIRKKLKKYTGGLTEADLEKVSSLSLSPKKETEKWSYIYTYHELKNHRPIWWGREGLSEVAKLKKFQNLKGMALVGCEGITDDGMRELVKLQQLSYLNLEGTAVTITGLKQISKLKNLSNLNLWGSGITDEGLKEVVKLTELKKLNLNNNEISDVGLKEIAKLTQLTSLSITSDYATEAGRDECKRLCRIVKCGLGVLEG